MGSIPGGRGGGDPLEERTATHSRILAWKIPLVAEPGELQSIGVAKSQTRLNNFHLTLNLSPTVPCGTGYSAQYYVAAWMRGV